MACQALEHTVFVYDQELEQEVDIDTLNLEAELEENTEVEEEMEMIMDNQEDDTVGALRTGMVDTHTFKNIITQKKQQKINRM